MKSIILAAGLGRRMQPLTDHVHKSLLPVGDSTILGRIVDGLTAIAVRDIVVVTGYRSNEIEGFLRGRYPHLPFHFVHNARYRETNNIVSLAMALDATPIDDDILLIESDVLFDPALLGRLQRRGGNVALVDRYRPGMDGTVVSVDNGVIDGVFPPHLQGEDFVYGDKFKTLNIYRFSREFCRQTFQPLLSCYANLIDQHCYYELVLGMLVNMQRERIEAEFVGDSDWAEVDDPNDLAVARFVFEPARRAEILQRAKGAYWNFAILDFEFLRNMYFPTDAMLASLKQALPQLVRNYGSAQAVLDEKLAAHLLCAPERVVLLNGLAQIFPLLGELLPARAPLVPAPTFGEFARWLSGAQTYTDAPGFDLVAITRALDGADLAVFVNPNNPTGTTLPTEWLHAQAAARPATRFVVDESFVDFSDEEPLLRRLVRAPLDNVVVLASLSKSLGVPGLRLGYLYSSDAALTGALRARLPIWNANSLAEYFLEISIKFRGERAESLERSRADRRQLADLLSNRGWVRTIHPSGGNFLLVQLTGEPARAAAAAAALLERFAIRVKDVSARFDPPAPRLRLAVRLPRENHQLCAALDEVLG